jgi:hypothetical protein
MRAEEGDESVSDHAAEGKETLAQGRKVLCMAVSHTAQAEGGDLLMDVS